MPIFIRGAGGGLQLKLSIAILVEILTYMRACTERMHNLSR